MNRLIEPLRKALVKIDQNDPIKRKEVYSAALRAIDRLDITKRDIQRQALRQAIIEIETGFDVNLLTPPKKPSTFFDHHDAKIAIAADKASSNKVISAGKVPRKHGLMMGGLLALLMLTGIGIYAYITADKSLSSVIAGNSSDAVTSTARAFSENFSAKFPKDSLLFAPRMNGEPNEQYFEGFTSNGALSISGKFTAWTQQTFMLEKGTTFIGTLTFRTQNNIERLKETLVIFSGFTTFDADGRSITHKPGPNMDFINRGRLPKAFDIQTNGDQSTITLTGIITLDDSTLSITQSATAKPYIFIRTGALPFPVELQSLSIQTISD